MAVGKHHLALALVASESRRAQLQNSIPWKHTELLTSGLVAGFHCGGGMVYSDVHVAPAQSGAQDLKLGSPESCRNMQPPMLRG